MAGEAKEKCAVVGVSIKEGNAAPLVYESLLAMQHRGDEASGIVSRNTSGRIFEHRGEGNVKDVFKTEILARLTGNQAIGHNRYSTSGSKSGHHQPFLDDTVGLSLSMNGNIPDTTKLEVMLSKHGIRTNELNDTEMIGHALALRLRSGLDLATAIEKDYSLFNGAFSCVALHSGSLIAFRDSCGIRPLALGKISGGYAVTSETCGLDIIDGTYLREVEPGEMVIISNGKIKSKQIVKGQKKLDMFEFVYFARHDSQLYGQSVNEVRRRFGEQLAKEYPPSMGDIENTIVVPVPDTSIPAAEGYADSLGLRHTQAIIKNRSIGRTFMQPTNSDRHKQLRRKHNMIPQAISGRDVILIDDSIVRMNTLPRLVESLYVSGARSVTALIASPPVRFPDFYGIDTPNQSELPAAKLSVKKMEMILKNGRKNTTQLGFLSIDGMVKATGLKPSLFNLSCFNGEYPIDIGKRKKDIKYTKV
ncbi:MAG TPA: amidophosphoribosyltransferase [Candidatus Saccharimonadia bacterium]|nr:amidophosphoribosyltransferase [Candidatus Saccharimonadia bacterium]